MLISILCISSFAETVYLGRSSKALLMGDAWTALSNNDEMTLFYNPASLGGNTSVSFYPINAKVGATNALDDMDRFSDFPSEAVGIVDKLLGFPVFLETSTFPGLKMLHFGFNLFATSKISLNLRNRIHPSFEIDYRYDRGFTTGFAFNIIGSNSAGSKTKKISSGQRLSVGYGLHYIRREGLKSKFDVFSPALLDKLEGGSLAELKNSFGYSTGKAFGHDVGLEYAVGNGVTEFSAGLSVLDVGGTRFKKLTGDSDVPMQEMLVNSGIGFKQDFTFFDYGVGLDLKPLNTGIPLSRMVHVGAYANIPFVSLFAGFAQGYINYGGELRFFPFKITLGFYNVELASDYREQQGKRAVLYFSLFDGSFDVF